MKTMQNKTFNYFFNKKRIFLPKNKRQYTFFIKNNNLKTSTLFNFVSC